MGPVLRTPPRVPLKGVHFEGPHGDQGSVNTFWQLRREHSIRKMGTEGRAVDFSLSSLAGVGWSPKPGKLSLPHMLKGREQGFPPTETPWGGQTDWSSQEGQGRWPTGRQASTLGWGTVRARGAEALSPWECSLCPHRTPAPQTDRPGRQSRVEAGESAWSTPHPARPQHAGRLRDRSSPCTTSPPVSDYLLLFT